MISPDYVSEMLGSCDLGDVRRNIVAMDFINAMTKSGSLIIRDLAQSRSEQVRFQRFLWNNSMDTDCIMDEAFNCTARRVEGREHVLAIQDTTEIAFSRKNDFDPDSVGKLKNRRGSGIYLHPSLVLDPVDDFVLGLASAERFSYSKDGKYDHITAREPIEVKKSYRWIRSAEQTKSKLAGMKKLTIVGDRESDFYEFYARVPDEKCDVLVRARKGRKVSFNGSRRLLHEISGTLPSLGELSVEVRARQAVTTGNRKQLREKRNQRNVTLEVKSCEVVIHKTAGCSEKDPKSLKLNLIDVREKDRTGSDAIHWMLLTTHPADDLEKCAEIIEWYRKRWHIEQLFRSIKRGGMGVEQMEISRTDAIDRLAALALLAGVKILQLTLCRDGKLEKNAEEVFCENQIEVMKIMLPKLEGSTKNLQNPFPQETLAWCHWIVGRLGGWMGQSKYGGPAGPKSIQRGLIRLERVTEGWQLAKEVPNVCIT